MHTSDVIYLGNLRTTAKHLASGNSIITDAPIDNNGKGEAFSPTDLLATAFAQCMITIMGIEANKLGVNIDGTKATVLKKMNLAPRKVKKIEVEITLPLAALDFKTQLEHAAHTCPVALSLHPDVEQHVTFCYV